MRIISDFKDYYDCIMRSGMDRNTIYKRFQKTFELDSGEVDNPFPYLFIEDIYKTEVEEILIGFCGNIYFCVQTSVPVYIEKSNTYKWIKEYFYNIDSFSSFLEKCNGYTKERYKKYFQKNFYYNKDRYSDFFMKYQVPIFVVNRDGGSSSYIHRRKRIITFNCKLQNYDFYKVFDPYTAFQELQMYIGGIAHPEDNTIQISDKDLLKQKGFDEKWSFRKEPTKRK